MRIHVACKHIDGDAILSCGIILWVKCVLLVLLTFLFRGQFSVLITSLSFYNVLFKTSARDIAIDLINMSLKCLDF